MAFYLPDRYFKRISDIDIRKDLLEQGIKNVLLDVDNTILTRDESIVPDDVQKWLKDARAAGITFCLVSNDWHSNVVDTSKDLKLPIVVKSLKPLPPAFFRALRKIGAKKKETLMIGDQLMTDILGAHCIGMKAYLLEPLVEQDLKHTLVLRKIERKLLNGRTPEETKKKENQK